MSAAWERLRGMPMPATMEPTTSAIAVRASRLCTGTSIDVPPDDRPALLMLDRPASDSLPVVMLSAALPAAELPSAELPFAMTLRSALTPVLPPSAAAGSAAGLAAGDAGSNTGASGDSAVPGCRRKPLMSTLCRRPPPLSPPLGRHQSALSAMLRRGCTAGSGMCQRQAHLPCRTMGARRAAVAQQI